MHKVAPCFLHQISVHNLKSVAFAPQFALKSVFLSVDKTKKASRGGRLLFGYEPLISRFQP